MSHPLRDASQALTSAGDPVTRAASDGVLYPTFDDDALAELAGFGQRRPISSGEVLFRPGDDPPDFLVILEGEVELVRVDEAGEAVIATFTARPFGGGVRAPTRPRL